MTFKWVKINCNKVGPKDCHFDWISDSDSFNLENRLWKHDNEFYEIPDHLCFLTHSGLTDHDVYVGRSRESIDSPWFNRYSPRSSSLESTIFVESEEVASQLYINDFYINIEKVLQLKTLRGKILGDINPKPGCHAEYLMNRVNRIGNWKLTDDGLDSSSIYEELKTGELANETIPHLLEIAHRGSSTTGILSDGTGLDELVVTILNQLEL